MDDSIASQTMRGRHGKSDRLPIKRTTTIPITAVWPVALWRAPFPAADEAGSVVDRHQVASKPTIASTGKTRIPCDRNRRKARLRFDRSLRERHSARLLRRNNSAERPWLG